MILSHVIHSLHVWRRYRACVRELSKLSDTALADIGLCRSGIHWTAWQVSRRNGCGRHASDIDDS